MPHPRLRAHVEAVRGTPLPHGLLGGCTEVVDATDTHQLNGTEHPELSCTDTHDTTWCPPGGGEVPRKTFERIGWCPADPVTVYAGVECSTFGWSYEESLQHASETLRLGASRALESWFMREILCSEASDLTPAAGPLSVVQALGVLETWLGDEYGGAGLIHAPVGAGALLSHGRLAFPADCACDNADACLRTLVGNGVVIGAGYSVNVGPPDCTVPEPGEAWLYATPPIRVRRGPVEPLPPEEAGGVAYRTNDRAALAEITYVVERACCKSAAVRIDLTVCP